MRLRSEVRPGAPATTPGRRGPEAKHETLAGAFLNRQHIRSAANQPAATRTVMFLVDAGVTRAPGSSFFARIASFPNAPASVLVIGGLSAAQRRLAARRSQESLTPLGLGRVMRQHNSTSHLVANQQFLRG